MIEISKKPFCICYCPDHTTLQLDLRVEYLESKIEKQIINYKNLIKKNCEWLKLKTQEQKPPAQLSHRRSPLGSVSQDFFRIIDWLKLEEQHFLVKVLTLVKDYPKWQNVIRLRKTDELF